MRIYVGADWSATEVVCVSGVADGTPRRLKGCSPSLGEVRDFLQRVRNGDHKAEVHVVLEAGSSVWPRLFHAAGAVVYVADAKQAERFRESRCSSGAKDDHRDALSLWYLGQSSGHCPKPLGDREPLAEELRRLGAAHERLIQRNTTLVQQLRSVAGQDMPLVTGALRRISSRWVLDFLERFPTAWHLSNLTESSFYEALKGSRSRKTTRATLWEAVRTTEAPWLTETLAMIVAVEVRELITGIRSTMNGLQQLDHRLESLLGEDERAVALRAIPGFGPVLVTTVLCFSITEESPHRDATSIRMGASPVWVGSGKRRNGQSKGYVRMRKSAPAIGRRMSYLMGRMVTWHTRWGRAKYADALRHGHRPAAAYRRIARSMLRIVQAMLRDGTAYDEEAYIARLQSNGVSWAQSIDVVANAA